ncbi:hypothetical protein AB833_08150 [Chromatiales bacterium (ex Bugula neritina AB1)]|nr:hypothetical protein AB833_08150 [Chromatiales bacterium (ex Bugula neritina AB1)]
MDNRFLLTVVFVAGVSLGWQGNVWWVTRQSEPPEQLSDNTQPPATQDDSNRQNHTGALELTIRTSADESSVNVDFSDPSTGQELTGVILSDTNTHALFTRLLHDRRYYDAMVLYQESSRNNGTTTDQLKRELLDHLSELSNIRNNSDFSDLIQNYLSIYYDDIDVLLLLAEFNQANGSYLEAADVYLLAKNYSYRVADQHNLLRHFSSFVDKTDRLYTEQKDWLSLINFYSHLETLGLMTSSHQFAQAIAHLGNGDRISAAGVLEQLVNDNLVGEKAANALAELSVHGGSTAISGDSVRGVSEAIALQQRGNQFLVDLTINRQDTVKLLIDTGASMTTLSQASFYSLPSSGVAIEQGRRVFHTANGVVQGTVYLVPEINLGPYLLTDTQVAVLDFDVVQGIDGLLGMNILGKFRFQIDQENRSLLLQRKE